MRLLGALPPSPFVPALLATFCDARRLYAVLSAVLVTDLLSACEATPLHERAARFYVAAAFRALSCVHRADAVCRACSLEALMLDATGYPQLADLSLAKVLASGRTHTLCGTPDYLAPEVVRMAGHGIEADYWALGVLMFELLAAHSPWEGSSGGGATETQPRDEMQVYAAISVHGREGAPPLPFPASLSQPARDMIDQLMEPDLADRLGCRGAGPEDLTEGTEWLVGFPWPALDQRLDPGAEAEPQWNLFRPKCEALASRFFNPDAAAEEVEFDAPAYYGENRWCAEWDFMCTAGCSVADAREAGRPGLARNNSTTRDTPR